MFNTGVATRKHTQEQKRRRLTQAATKCELYTRKTQNLPKSSDKQISVGDTGALALWTFSYTHTHTHMESTSM